MIEVFKASLPLNSLLQDRVSEQDFVDCYRVNSQLSARQAATIALNFPDWVRLLMRMRHLLTAPLGLSNAGPANAEQIGALGIETETDHELILGFDDLHLNFRVSVLSNEESIFLSTWVHTHNRIGRIYLRAVMPFHVAIVRDALQRVVISESASSGKCTHAKR